MLTGRVVDAERLEAHVASLVVHARPEHVPQIVAALTGMPGVEVPAASGGKLIVTLETASEADIVTRMTEMSLLPGVLSAALVFHHFEIDPISEANP
jgi:nitrate reductase NapD